MLVFDLSDPAVNADPFPTFARLRDWDPVHWSPAMKAWILTRYDDVKQLALNAEDYSANRLTPFFDSMQARGGVENLARYLTHWMVFQDPPEHTRLRRLFTRVFTVASVDALRSSIERCVDALLDTMEAKAAAGDALDWISDFAYPLPATVIMDLLGVPRADLQRIKHWSDDIALFIGSAQASANKYALAEAGARAMAEYFRGLLDERASAPRDDLMTRLVLARDENDALSADEVIGTCILLLFAGHETTTNLVGNGFLYSMKFREQWERVCADSALVPDAVEEWLRYDGPSGAIARVVARDHELHGRTLLRRQRVFAFLNAANRDPAVFESAESFDLARSPNPHLTFGHGIHFCLGAPLARLEAQIALRQTALRHPGIRIDGGTLAWHDSLILRGVKQLPVRLR